MRKLGRKDVKENHSVTAYVGTCSCTKECMCVSCNASCVNVGAASRRENVDATYAYKTANVSQTGPTYHYNTSVSQFNGGK